MARKTLTTKKTAEAVAKPAPTPAQDAVVMKKPDLLDRVVTRTNLKKRDVKPAVETALAVIGEALRDGNELVLPPLGKLRVVKSKDLGEGAAVLTLKLRTPKNAAKAATSERDEA